MKPFLILITCLCCSCSAGLQDRIPPLNVSRGAGVLWQRHISATMDKCRYEVSVIVITKYELNRNMTKEDVERLDRKLMDQCANYYKISV